MGRPRFLIRLPSQTPVWVHGPIRYMHRLHTVSAVSTLSKAGGRRRRAAGDDLWRNCQYGDCKEDIRNKYTQNTLADRLLKWLGSALYLGGLTIGTGSSAATAGETVVSAAAGGAGSGVSVPWPELYGGPGRPGSFIPVERPFTLPGSDLPVQVDTAAPVRPSVPDPAPNTFVNPAFEADIVSISSGDNVVITDVTPAPPLPDAPDLADLEIPEGRRTRGDTFVTQDELAQLSRTEDMLTAEVPESANPFVPPRTSDPSPRGPFVSIELQPYSTEPPPVEPYASTSFGGDADWAFDDADVPYHSTPLPGRGGPGATVEFANPAYVPDYVDAEYQRVLSEESAALFGPPGHADAAATLGTPVLRARGPRISISRLLRRPGMLLRSGRRVPFTVRLLGDMSPVTLPGEPDSVQLRAFTPTGFGDAFAGDLGIAEHSLSHADTLPWDGNPIDITDVVQGFEEVPLDDPELFPEMEVMEDDAPEGYPVAGPARSNGSVSFWAPGTTHTGHPVSGGVRVYGPDIDVLPPPDRPGVIVSFYGYGTVWDPSLYWLFFRKRKRLHRLFYR
ncbi:L2 [Kittiwake papillomavirus 2]|uniref:L2 n=1 Tax=Kittiwake papillomavirus 2 TaxID=2562551 RepID=A0AAE5YMU6_9PAPI|nr:L2 [Kittiwake papillomavirus 2]